MDLHTVSITLRFVHASPDASLEAAWAPDLKVPPPAAAGHLRQDPHKTLLETLPAAIHETLSFEAKTLHKSLLTTECDFGNS